MITRIVTVAGQPDREADLATQLAGHRELDLVLRCVDRVELLAAIRGGDLDVIVLVGIPPWMDRELWHEAAVRAVRVLVLVEAGAHPEVPRDVVVLPIDTALEQIATVLQRTEGATPSSPPRTLQSQPRSGRVVAVWGPKGAPGRTTIAIELAVALAAAQPLTALVDADPYGGDVLQFLGIVEELPTIVWAARMAAKGELDGAQLLMELRRAGRNGPVVLPGLPRPELWPDVSDYGWRELLAIARRTFVTTVVDVGFCIEPDVGSFADSADGRNRMATATLTHADHVVAVCKGDATGIRHFIWAYDALKALVPEEDVLIVVNRAKG